MYALLALAVNARLATSQRTVTVAASNATSAAASAVTDVSY